jgi:hypothetical protein
LTDGQAQIVQLLGELEGSYKVGGKEEGWKEGRKEGLTLFVLKLSCLILILATQYGMEVKKFLDKSSISNSLKKSITCGNSENTLLK